MTVDIRFRFGGTQICDKCHLTPYRIVIVKRVVYLTRIKRKWNIVLVDYLQNVHIQKNWSLEKYNILPSGYLYKPVQIVKTIEDIFSKEQLFFKVLMRNSLCHTRKFDYLNHFFLTYLLKNVETTPHIRQLVQVLYGLAELHFVQRPTEWSG